MADRYVTSGPVGRDTPEDRTRRGKMVTIAAARNRALSMVDEGYSDDEIDEYLASKGLTAKDLRTFTNRKKKAAREDAPGNLASGVVAWADQGIPFFDEAVAGVEAGLTKAGGDKRKLRDIYKNRKEQVDFALNRFAENEGATTLGRIGGALHQGAITGRLAVPKGAGVKRALTGLAAEGAGTAAVEAADQAEGGLVERGKAALKAAPIGAGLGLTLGGASMALPGLTRTVLRGGKKGRASAEQALRDFERAGVDPTVGQIAKSGFGQSLESGMRNMPFVQKPLLDTYKGQDVAMREVMDKVRHSMGPGADIQDAAGAGARIREGTDSWIKRMQKEQARKYTDIGNRVGWKSPTSVVNTVQALRTLQDRIPDVASISNLFSNPKLGQMFDAVLNQAQKGPFTFQAVKQMRTEIGRMLESPSIISDVPRGELKQLYAALTHDLDIAVANVSRTRGRGIYRSWKRANNFTKQLHDRVESTLEPILRKSADEDVFTAATRKGSTLRTVLKSVALPEERRAVVGTMLHRMAQAPPGYQDATGELFSAQSFLTNWNKLTQHDPDAKAAILSQLPEDAREQFKALLRVAGHRKEAASAMANPSGTAGNISFQAVFAGLMWSLMGMTKAAGAIVGGRTLAKGMSNPKAARWAVKPTKSNTLTRAAAIGLPGLNSVAVQGMFGDQ